MHHSEGKTRPDHDGIQDEVIRRENMLRQELSRRSFLLGLSALALSACGGGGEGSAGAADEQAQRLADSAADQPIAQAAPQGAAEPVGNTGSTFASASGFVHPGLLHTSADFTRMVANINNEPWKSGWNVLLNNPHASLGFAAPRAVSVVYRGYDGTHPENYTLLYNDIAAAYACALRWKIAGDTAYADKAVQIMKAWSSTLTNINGTSDKFLAAGIYGYEFANVGEIMRTYGGLAAADLAAFQNMMRNIFYPINHTFLSTHNGTTPPHYWANWDLCNMASMLAIGVLCDDQSIFDEAVGYFKNGRGNGSSLQSVYYVHPGYLGQWQESGRDQGHNTLGIALMGAFCEMAWNQGVDLYGWNNNRFLMGAEYVAKGNLIQSGSTYDTVPYVFYNNVDRVNQASFSTIAQGAVRPCWALVYHHYVNRCGIAAPYTKKFMERVTPEGGGGNYGAASGGFDQLGYGTLTCTRPSIPAGAPPSGLTVVQFAGKIVLSWWGSAYATSYNVKRATSSNGPFTVLANDIADLLTYTDSSAASGTWYYAVTANTPDGESAPSNVAACIGGIALHTLLSFDEGTGVSAADSSGNGHTGTLAGGAAWGGGRGGNAISLNGAGAYVALPPDLMTGMGDFTIATWAFWNSARTWDRIFDFGTGAQRYMMLTARAPNGVGRFAITLNERDGEMVVDCPWALPRASWFHIAVTLSGNLCTVYVNGTAVGSNAGMMLTPAQIGHTDRNWLGRSQRDGEPSYSGRIDDFRIYHGALSASQVAALMNGQPI